MEQKRLMVVDAYNQFLRSYIVDPSLSTNGQPIGGCKGFLKILNKLTREIKPDLTVLVWDGEGGSNKRRALNKNYKAGRKPPKLNRGNSTLTPEEIKVNRRWQQVRVIDYLNQTPMVQFMEPEVEADDVIAQIINSSRFNDWQKVIVSSDKDFIQLLGSNTVLFRPTQKQVLNKNAIVEQYGIHPNNFALARSIVGDSSDNIEGVPSIGLGTVAKRYPTFKGSDEIYLGELIEHCEEQLENKKKLKSHEKIIEYQDRIRDNYKLMQLHSPCISIQGKERINYTFDNYVPEFNKTGLRTLLLKDGAGEINLSSLYESFNRLISNFTLAQKTTT